MKRADRIEKKRLKRWLRSAWRQARRVRGRQINMAWLHWFEEWCDAWEALQERGWDRDRNLPGTS